MLLIETLFCGCWRSCLENIGSAKAIRGFGADDTRDLPRKTFMFATDGQMVMACERASQSISLYCLSLGSLVTNRCRGRLVNAPFVTTDRRVFEAILSAKTPNVSR